MWSLTTDIMVKQTIHQCILDQRIPPLLVDIRTAKMMCSVLPIDSENNNFNVYQRLLCFLRQVINTIYLKCTYPVLSCKRFTTTCEMNMWLVTSTQMHIITAR